MEAIWLLLFLLNAYSEPLSVVHPDFGEDNNLSNILESSQDLNDNSFRYIRVMCHAKCFDSNNECFCQCETWLRNLRKIKSELDLKTVEQLNFYADRAKLTSLEAKECGDNE